MNSINKKQRTKWKNGKARRNIKYIKSGEILPKNFKRLPGLKFREREISYIEFCKRLTELYEENEDLTIQNLCDYVEQEYGYKMGIRKMRRILDKYDARIRGSAPKRKKSEMRHPALNCTLTREAYNFIQAVDSQFEGKYARRELVKFVFDMLIGKPSEHLIIWLDDFKPAVILWDNKQLKYTLIAETLSKVEMAVFEPMLKQADEEKSLEVVQSYARSKKLLFWGGHSLSEIIHHK